MAVSGTVDAAVNGGTKNYESFITGAYRVANPEIAEDIDANPQKVTSPRTDAVALPCRRD